LPIVLGHDDLGTVPRLNLRGATVMIKVGVGQQTRGHDAAVVHHRLDVVGGDLDGVLPDIRTDRPDLQSGYDL